MYYNCMKKFLIVSMSPMRGNTTGITGKLLEKFTNIDKNKYSVSLFDTSFFDQKHNPENYPVDHYYSLPVFWIEKYMRKIPGVRSWYANWLIVKKFRLLLKENKFDLIVLYHTPVTSDELIRISHKHGIKVIMYPWGGEILCATKFERHLIKSAFDKVDFVGGAEYSNCSIAAKELYGVPDTKFRYSKLYISGVAQLQKLKGTKSRKEMHRALNIPLSDYNIVCAYNGYPTHRHELIVDNIISNKEVLPNNYQLIFPMTYGANDDYIKKLKQLCDDNGLRYCFITEFMTNEQMAYLHLLTDLLINIQDSDCGNAFMIEALFAQNQIVTGRWLGYKQFEQFGVPYHLIDTPEELKNKLAIIFTGKGSRPVIPQELLDMYRIPEGYVACSYWTNLIDSI